MMANRSNSSSRTGNHAATTVRVAQILTGSLIASLCISVLIFSSIGSQEVSKHQQQHIHQADSFTFALEKNETLPITSAKEQDAPSYRLAKGLSCQKWGGPTDELAAEMVYWRNIPSDAKYSSPFFNPNANEKYLFFDADPAGFNNKRISFENFLLMAHTMGRTLVMPPKGFWWGFQKVYGEDKPLQESPRWSFEDFYDLDKIHQAGLKVISMEDFLLQHAMTGKLKTQDGKVSFPPENRTNWNEGWLKRMRDWLKTVTVQIKWRPEDCLAAFPSHPLQHHVESLEKTMHELRRNPPPGPERWLGHPTPVNAPVMDRLSEVLAGRTQLCYYDEQLQNETYLYYKIVYDPTTYEGQFVTNIRLLIWFYQFFFFEDWMQDVWSKRFIRDRLRYKDELQCIAARVVAAMREKARAKHNGNDQFDSFHIRRSGEFEEQYGNLTDNAAIYNTSAPDIPEGSTVFIATDDMNRTLFQPLMDHYDVYFLGDFKELLGDLNANYYSIIDQLVASRGRVFFGAFCSTFTGYINRMRGYRSQKDKAEGWRSGIVDSYFYNFQGLDKRNKMRIYHPPIKMWFAREFPIAWRDIDHDLVSYEDEDK